MNDDAAIRLFEEAGNPAREWGALDDRDRWPWRKMALEREAAQQALVDQAQELDMGY